jgi:hypothetical protein
MSASDTPLVEFDLDELAALGDLVVQAGGFRVAVLFDDRLQLLGRLGRDGARSLVVAGDVIEEDSVWATGGADLVAAVLEREIALVVRVADTVTAAVVGLDSLAVVERQGPSRMSGQRVRTCPKEAIPLEKWRTALCRHSKLLLHLNLQTHVVLCILGTSA